MHFYDSGRLCQEGAISSYYSGVQNLTSRRRMQSGVINQGKREKGAHRRVIIATNKCFLDILGYSNIS